MTHMSDLPALYRFDIVLRGRRQTFFESKKEGVVVTNAA